MDVLWVLKKMPTLKDGNRRLKKARNRRWKRIKVRTFYRPVDKKTIRFDKLDKTGGGKAADMRPQELNAGRLQSEQQGHPIVKRGQVGHPAQNETFRFQNAGDFRKNPIQLLCVFQGLVGNDDIKNVVIEGERIAFYVYGKNLDALFPRGLNIWRITFQARQVHFDQWIHLKTLLANIHEVLAGSQANIEDF